MNSDHAKIIDKIRKLLALSQSPNEAEAASAAAKAHQLLREHNLSLGDIGDDPAGKVKLHPHVEMRTIPPWRRHLGAHVARANYCGCILMRTPLGRVLFFVGRPHNVVATGVLFDYLEKTVIRLSRQLTDRRFNKEKFRDGLVYGLGVRIRESLQTPEENSTALVLLNKEVEDFLSKLRTTSSPGAKVDYNTASFNRGFQASKGINLNRQLSGGVA